MKLLRILPYTLLEQAILYILLMFNLQILEDSDRDGEPNELPEDYDDTTVTPMVEDLDDDG